MNDNEATQESEKELEPNKSAAQQTQGCLAGVITNTFNAVLNLSEKVASSKAGPLVLLVLILMTLCFGCSLIASIGSSSSSEKAEVTVIITKEVEVTRIAEAEPVEVTREITVEVPFPVTSTASPGPSPTPTMTFTPTITSSPTITPSPTVTPSVTPTEDVRSLYEEIDVRELTSYANNHIGKMVILRGVVFNIGEDFFQINVQIPGGSRYDTDPVIISYLGISLPTGLYENTNVTIYGTVMGTLESTNAFGATIVQPWVDAAIIELR